MMESGPNWKCCQKPSAISPTRQRFHVEPPAVMMVTDDWSDWAEGDESMAGEHGRLAYVHTCTSVRQVGINLLAVGSLWSPEGTRVRALIPVLRVK